MFGEQATGPTCHRAQISPDKGSAFHAPAPASSEAANPLSAVLLPVNVDGVVRYSNATSVSWT